MSRTLTGWGFTSPFLLLFGVFLLVPIVASLALAFTSFGIGNIQSWGTTEFVGLENFSKLFGDDLFWKSVRNTAYFVVVGVPLTVGGGLLLAAGLNQGIGKPAHGVPRRLLRAGRHQHRRDRGDLALPAGARHRRWSTRCSARSGSRATTGSATRRR